MPASRAENQWPARRRRKRAAQRGRLLRTLRRALLFQAILTVVLVAFALLATLVLPTKTASGLLAVAFLLPAWLAGLYAGAAAPRSRWWQLLCSGAVGAMTFGLLSMLAGPGLWSPATRCWVAANLAGDFLLAGWMGRRWRLGPSTRSVPAPVTMSAPATPEAEGIRRAG